MKFQNLKQLLHKLHAIGFMYFLMALGHVSPNVTILILVSHDKLSFNLIFLIIYLLNI